MCTDSDQSSTPSHLVGVQPGRRLAGFGWRRRDGTALGHPELARASGAEGFSRRPYRPGVQSRWTATGHRQEAAGAFRPTWAGRAEFGCGMLFWDSNSWPSFPTPTQSMELPSALTAAILPPPVATTPRACGPPFPGSPPTTRVRLTSRSPAGSRLTSGINAQPAPQPPSDPARHLGFQVFGYFNLPAPGSKNQPAFPTPPRDPRATPEQLDLTRVTTSLSKRCGNHWTGCMTLLGASSP